MGMSDMCDSFKQVSGSFRGWRDIFDETETV